MGGQYICGMGLSLEKFSIHLTIRSVSVTVENTKFIKMAALQFV